MKIYTKTGDMGETSTFGGKRVKKSNIRIKVNGEVDELNSVIGMIVAHLEYSKMKDSLNRIQVELMELGADISLGTVNPITKEFRLKEENVEKLESEIDIWEADLAPLKNFILPGGSVEGSFAHFARSVCRRVEREVIALSYVEKLNPSIPKYLNRLSDWLFVLARKINQMKSSPEVKFNSQNNSKK